MVRTGKETNEYLVAFFEKSGIAVGQEYDGYHYQKWIMAKHVEFRDLMGMPRNIRLSDENVKKFIRFINGGPDAITQEERDASAEEMDRVYNLVYALSGSFPEEAGK